MSLHCTGLHPRVYAMTENASQMAHENRCLRSFVFLTLDVAGDEEAQELVERISASRGRRQRRQTHLADLDSRCRLEGKALKQGEDHHLDLQDGETPPATASQRRVDDKEV